MNKFLIFCFALVPIVAILGFVYLVIENHPFMAVLLFLVALSVNLKIENKG